MTLSNMSDEVSDIVDLQRRLLLSSVVSLLAPRFVLGASSQQAWRSFPGGSVQRVAFGSCAKQWEPQPIWYAVADVDPDLFLFLGDNIYGDWHGKKPFVPTADSLRADYGQLAQKPEFVAVQKQVAYMATWDNHDYGRHDGGADFELKEMSREVFLDFFGEPPSSPRRQRDGIYDARIFGPEGQRVQIILLDNRWNRGALSPGTRSKEEREALGIFGSMGHIPNDDPSAALLGEEQWRWLEDQLREPAELRLIASGTQIVPDQKGMQEWGNFLLECDFNRWMQHLICNYTEEDVDHEVSDEDLLYRRTKGIDVGSLAKRRIFALYCSIV